MKNMYLPTPLNISNMWSMGVLLSSMLIVQLITGIFISMNYSNSVNQAFTSYMLISRNVQKGFFIKYLHANGASFMFMFLYMHMFRSLSLKSPKNIYMWVSGMFLLILSMATAFLGYVLPWGQMSFWAATVITNLISSIPYLGEMLTKWLWGGFSVGNPTLNRFFSFHFLVPMMMAALSLIHLMILHNKGSSMPLGMNSNIEKIPFKQFFLSKDLLAILLMILILMIMTIQYSFLFIDPENFLPANPLVTPSHIQPEWYFLFAYAILRSIPNKLGGVMALFLSIFIFFIKFLSNGTSKFNIIFMVKNNLLIMSFIVLTYLGSQEIEEPFLILSKTFSIIYFLSFVDTILVKNHKYNK